MSGYDPNAVNRMLGLPVEEEEERRVNQFGVPYKKSTYDTKAVDRLLAAPEQEEVNRNYFEWIGQGLGQGKDQAYASIKLASWLHGGPDSADSIAEYFRSRETPEFTEELTSQVDRINEAEGFWESTVEVGRFIGKTVTNPKATSYLIVEQLANMVPTLAGGLAGAGAGSLVAPVAGTFIGGIFGMSAGTTASTIGEKGFEMLQKYGANMTDENSIRETFSNQEFQAEALKKGYAKGLTISAIDAFTFRMGGKIITAPGKALEKSIQKELAEAGVEKSVESGAILAQLIKKNPKLRDNIAGHVETYLAAAGKASDETLSAIQKAATQFGKSTTTLKNVGRGTAAVGLETLGEGVGEYSGEFVAEGEGKLGDAVLESVTSLGQSATTVALAKTLSGATRETKKAVREIRARQIDRLNQGKDSGLDPSEINKAQQTVNEGETAEILNRQAEIDQINTVLDERDSINPDIAELENYIDGLENRESLDPAVETLEDLDNYVEYKADLLNTVGEQYGDEVVLHVAVTPEEKGSLEAESPSDEKPSLEGYIVGSLDEKGAPNLPNTETVRVTVPIQDIVGRADSSKGQLVVRAEKIKSAKLVEESPKKKDAAEKPLLDTAKRRVAEIKQEEQLEQYETEARQEEGVVRSEESKKADPQKTTRSTVRQSKDKLGKIPTVPEIKSRRTEDGRRITRPVLSKLVVGNKIPTTTETERGKANPKASVESLRDDVADYRSALESPNSLRKVNVVLEKQGYRIKTQGKEKRLVLVDNDGNTTELNTARVQEKSIDEYLTLTDKLLVEAEKKRTKKQLADKEQKGLGRIITREEKRPLDLGPAKTILDTIERKFVTRDQGTITIDETGLQNYVEQVRASQEWKAKDLQTLDRGVRRLRQEAEVTPPPKTKPSDRASVVVGIKPSEDVSGLRKVGRLAGTKLKEFHRKAVNLTRTGERDELLGKITKIFAPASDRLAKGAKGKVEPTTVRTLTKKTDSNRTAKVYALSNMLIYFQDEVSWSRPDATLDVADDATVLNVRLTTDKILNDSQFGKLYKDVQRIVGENAEIIRIGNNEFVVRNESINKSQFARRMGRLKGKRGKTYGLQAEFFTSKTETLSHDWASEPSGESIRNQIRDLGFSDLLPYLDNRRDAYLKLAEENGARIEGLERAVQQFVGPPVPKGKVRAAIAHHGTGNALEGGKFNLQFVGTGEGHQAFGWGIYLAQLKKIAEHYKDTLGQDKLFIGNEPFEYTNPVHMAVNDYGAERRIFIRKLLGKKSKELYKESVPFLNEIKKILLNEYSREDYIYLRDDKNRDRKISYMEFLHNLEDTQFLSGKFTDNNRFSEKSRFDNTRLDRALKNYLPLARESNNLLDASYRLNNEEVPSDVMESLGVTEESIFPSVIKKVRNKLRSNIESSELLDDVTNQTISNNLEVEVKKKAYEYANTLSSFTDLPPISRRRLENLYTVDIDDSVVDRMLDYNITLREQPEVFQLLKDYWDSEVGDPDIIMNRLGINEDSTGWDLYISLTGRVTNTEKKKQASLYLSKSGIPGLKYLDAASRNVTGVFKERTRNFVIWDQEVLDNLDMNPPPVRGSVFQTEPASGGFFNARVRKELTGKFGEEGISNLERDGVIRIVSSVYDIPVGVRDRFENYDLAHALYDENSGTSYLIEDMIPKGTAPNILMHEVGVHYGLKQMLGPDRFAELTKEVLDKQNDPNFAPYFKQVADSYEFLLKEGDDAVYSEDFIEEVIAKIAEDPKALDRSIIQKLFRYIREFFQRFNFANELTTGDIQAAVRGALRQSMDGTPSVNVARQDRVLASLTGNIERAKEALFNALPRSDDRFGHLPFVLNQSLSEEDKKRDFSTAEMTNAEKKRARKTLVNALNHIQRSFNAQAKGTNLKIHFATNTPDSERLVHLYNPDTDAMLTFRFGFSPESPTRMSMLTPVVDFTNMANETINTVDIDKAIFLLKNRDLKRHSALSFYIDHRLGSKVPSGLIAGLDQRAGKDSFKSFIARLSETDPNRYRYLLDAEQVSIDSGILRQHVTPTTINGKVRASIPSRSTNDVSDAGVALINRANGSTKRNSLLESLETARQEGWLWVTQGAVDRYRSVQKKLGDAGHKAWQMMHLSDNSTNLMHAVLHFGRPIERKFNGKFDGYDIDPDSKGLIEILQDVGGETDRFLTWIVGNRAGKLLKEGREQNFTADDVKEMKLLSKGRMEDGRNRGLVYMKAMREIAKFQGAMLDMAMNAGVISKEDRATLTTDFYLPFYREFEQKGKTKVRGPVMTADFVNIRDVIRGLSGSPLEVNDVLHNLMMNWASLMNASMKNRAGVAAVEAAENAGIAVRVPKKDAAKISFTKRKSISDVYQDHIYVFKDGEKVWYQIQDPMILQSLLALNFDAGQLKGMKALSTFKRYFTYGVTASPAFKIRNLIRDSMHSVAVGDLSYNIFGNVKEGLAVATEDNKIFRSMLAGGGAFEFGFLHDDPAALRRIVNYGMKHVGRGMPKTEKEMRERILDTSAKGLFFLKKGWGKYQQLGNMMENANRVSLYMKRVGEVGHMQANFEARDLLNFSSHGNWVATQYLIGSVSFLNARVQGLSKLGRSAKDHKQRGKLMAVVGTTVLASVLLELGMGDDEEYKKLPNWVRDTYWPIKLPGEDNWFLLPKPFEIGAMASIAQRFTQQFVDNSADPELFTERLVQIIQDQLAFDWRPQMLRPAWEVMANKDEFKDRPIETLGWRISNKSKTLMEHKYTSSFASGLSRAIDAVYPGETPLSPVQIDHLVKGYFGWLGATIVGSADILFSDEKEATKRLDEYYGIVPIGSFIRLGPPKHTRSSDLFYEQLEEINELKANYNHYKKFEMDKELRELLAEQDDVLKWYRLYNRMNRKIGELNNEIGIIHEDETLSPDQKREEIDKRIESKNNITSDLIKIRRREDRPEERGTSIISDARAEASVDDDYDVAALQEAITRGMENQKNSIEERLYDSIFKAEFSPLTRFKPFIRTRHSPKGGSSAYGPLQITTGLMKSAESQLTLTKKEKDYVRRFINQGEKFLEFGNEPDREGYEKKYDYGGEGDLTTNSDKRLYKQVGKKLIRLVWDQSGGDWKAFINAWRYGEGSNKDVEKADKRYFAAFTDSFGV